MKINDAVIHMALADAYALVQNRSEAIEHYDIAFSLDPSMKNAQVKVCFVTFFKLWCLFLRTNELTE